jgi:hypothetical protein
MDDSAYYLAILVEDRSAIQVQYDHIDVPCPPLAAILAATSRKTIWVRISWGGDTIWKNPDCEQY